MSQIVPSYLTLPLALDPRHKATPDIDGIRPPPMLMIDLLGRHYVGCSRPSVPLIVHNFIKQSPESEAIARYDNESAL